MLKLFGGSARQPLAPRGAAATREDIAFCYRLLLGREPGPAEWESHAGKIGQDLTSVVRSFTSSAEFAHRGLLMPAADSGETHLPGATLNDIYFCFRLLLGRMPHVEERVGHAGHEGKDLASVVALYLGSQEFARRGLLTPPQDDVCVLVEQDGFRIYVARGDMAVGQHIAGSAYEPDVTAAFRRILQPGMSVIDIGANIGYFTMLSAYLVGPAGNVLAIEPNPRNMRLLEASRLANAFMHVRPYQSAAGREAGLLVLNTAYSNGTTSMVGDDPAGILRAETVACVAVDTLVNAQDRVDFIKVDVEGAEYNALLGCRSVIETHRPIILSEFSPSMLSGTSGISGRDYLAWLMGRGYSVAVIAPDGSTGQGAADADMIMRDYEARGTDHIDLLATPV